MRAAVDKSHAEAIVLKQRAEHVETVAEQQVA
jgi:hypothetical protein